MTIRVLVADDPRLVRTGFRTIIEADQIIDVVAEAADAPGRLKPAASHHPDVELMDICMPKVERLGRHAPRPP